MLHGLNIDRVAVLYAGICIVLLMMLCAGLMDALEYQVQRNRLMMAFIASDRHRGDN